MKITIWKTEIFNNAADGKSLRVYYEAMTGGWSRKSEDIFPLDIVRGKDLLEWIYSSLVETTWNSYKIYQMKDPDEISGKKEIPELKRLRKTVPSIYWVRKALENGQEE